MKRKYYCYVCDMVDSYLHCREHLNWEEHSTPENVALAEERRIGYEIMLEQRVRRINEKDSNT